MMISFIMRLLKAVNNATMAQNANSTPLLRLLRYLHVLLDSLFQILPMACKPAHKYALMEHFIIQTQTSALAVPKIAQLVHMMRVLNSHIAPLVNQA
jgi:hypothetical protein